MEEHFLGAKQHMFDFHLPPPSSALRGDSAGMVEGWGVFSPIMPSGTFTPVTFRNLTFSPGGVERRSVVIGWID